MVGKTVSHYRVLEKLGGGGMGVVYRARDERLGRDVALKVLPEAFAQDPERLARFKREAQLLASLNHPHIAAIYGFEESDLQRFLVLEYVPGKTLAEQLKTGPFDLGDALAICRQIAEALEAAHDKGIIHRDLKPANIKVTPEEKVKVLDFGLAKAFAGDELARDISDSPTVTSAATREGIILGTAAYMSPEQARGKSVDKRTDIWSFGCVLYESLTGHPTFRGETISDTIASVLKTEPDWQKLPETSPTNIRTLLRRCLEKPREKRLRDAGDARIEIEDALAGSPAAAVPTPTRGAVSRRAPWTFTLVGVAITALIMAFWPIPAPEPPPLIPFATESEVQTMPRWSSKGDQIAYVAAVHSVLQVFTKSLGSSVATQITHEKEACLNPVWSLDGTRIYYLTGRRPNNILRSIAVAGGPSEKVLARVISADLSPNGRTLALLFFDSKGLGRLGFSSPPGTPPQPYSGAPLSEWSVSGASAHLRFDPTGKYLGLATMPSRPQFWRIPLDGGLPEEMLHGAVGVGGHFIWLSQGAGIVDDSQWPLWGELHLAIVDLSSMARRSITHSASQDSFPSLSPDGSALAFASGELGYDIIEVPLDGSTPRDVIATARQDAAPAWAPDGVHFAYVTDRSGKYEIWLRNRADGSERYIVGPTQFPEKTTFWDCAISPDGTRVAYRRWGELTGGAIYISPLTGDVPVPLWGDPAKSPQRGPSWSPDRNWIAYYGDHNGKPAVMKARVGANAPAQFVAEMADYQPVRWSPRGDWIAFRDRETLRVVSPDGKQNRLISQPAWETYGWSKDGTALYGIARDENHRLLVGKIDVATGKESRIADLGPVPPAFDLDDSYDAFAYRGFSLHPDGKSFLTFVLRAKMQIYLTRDFDRTVRLADRWWRRQ